VPVVEQSGATVRVVCGAFGGVTGPFAGIAVNPTVLDVQLAAGASLSLPAPQGEATFAYVVQGGLIGSDPSLSTPQLIVFGDGESVSVTATEEGVRFLFVSATVLNEPVLQYRSLVMNTVEDIQETLEMIESGTFAK
jgi:redox-sensitive bicupin YhaK (pirin superfamily)